MTRGSIQEYREAVRERYFRAGKRDKGRILDGFVNVTGYHRKSAIRLLHQGNQGNPRRRRGRPRKYGHYLVEALKIAWGATDRLCSQRLQPFLSELIGILRRCGEKTMTVEVEARLCQMSPSTIDRLLKPYRRLGDGVPLPPPSQEACLKTPFPSALLLIGVRIVLASLKQTWCLTVGKVLMVSI